MKKSWILAFLAPQYLYSFIPQIRNNFLLKASAMSTFTNNFQGENDGRGVTPKEGTIIEGEIEATKSWTDLIEISIAKSRKIRGGNYVQIATVDSTGLPNVRTVVFRGFLNFDSTASSNSKLNKKNLAMKMITDARSEKVSHIKENPSCEMVWWFAKSSEQYRIRGNLVLISDDPNEQGSSEELVAARKQQWGNLSDAAREQFYWNVPGIAYDGIPGTPIGGRDAETGSVLPVPDTFRLLLLIPHRVKYLRLTDNYAQIDELITDDTDTCGEGEGDEKHDKSQWNQRRVNP